MTSYKPRAARGGADPLAARHQAPAQAGRALASPRPERAPTRCKTCGHITIPAPRCQCGHLDVQHDLAKDNETRTACSHSEGPKATPCGCRRFEPETETSHA